MQDRDPDVRLDVDGVWSAPHGLLDGFVEILKIAVRRCPWSVHVGQAYSPEIEPVEPPRFSENSFAAA